VELREFSGIWVHVAVGELVVGNKVTRELRSSDPN
jgi:hypothetical protein